MSPLLQYQETGTVAHDWNQDFTSTSYDYPAYEAPPERQHPGYYAYDEPPPAPYTPAAYEERQATSTSPTVEGGADRSFDVMMSGAYRYDAKESRYPAYSWVNLSQDADVDEMEEGIDEKSAAQFYQEQTLRFGAPPEGPTRRRGTKLKKTVVLTDGNLVVDLPVPTNLRLGRTKDVLDEMRSVRFVDGPDVFQPSQR